MNLSWSFIAKALGMPFLVSTVDFPVRVICTDSRKIMPGDVFLAIIGPQFDGHQFIEAALSHGAVGCIVSKPGINILPTFLVTDTLAAYAAIALAWRLQFIIPMVAITGSIGKTSTKHILAHLFSACGPTLAPVGSFNNEIGVPQTLLQLTAAHQYAVIEMGACHPGDIAYLMQCTQPTASIVTTCAPVHMESFCSLEMIVQEKGSIYDNLPMDGIAIVNKDTPFSENFITRIGKRPHMTFGVQNLTADVTASDIVATLEGSHFTLHTPMGAAFCYCPFPSLHQLSNALAAITAALAVGTPFDRVSAALASCPPLDGRLRVFTAKCGARIIDDSYNANPTSVKAAMQLLSEQSGLKVLVLGDMAELGPNAAEIHKDIGLTAKALAIDRLFSFGPMAAIAAEEFNGHAYTTQEALLNDLSPYLQAEVIFLIKGSHVMRMFDIVTAIKNLAG